MMKDDYNEELLKYLKRVTVMDRFEEEEKEQTLKDAVKVSPEDKGILSSLGIKW